MVGNLIVLSLKWHTYIYTLTHSHTWSCVRILMFEYKTYNNFKCNKYMEVFYQAVL